MININLASTKGCDKVSNDSERNDAQQQDDESQSNSQNKTNK